MIVNIFFFKLIIGLWSRKESQVHLKSIIFTKLISVASELCLPYDNRSDSLKFAIKWLKCLCSFHLKLHISFTLFQSWFFLKIISTAISTIWFPNNKPRNKIKSMSRVLLCYMLKLSQEIVYLFRCFKTYH